MCARAPGLQERFPAEYTAAMTAAGVLASCHAGVRRPWLPLSMDMITALPPMNRYPDMYYWQLGARAQVAATGGIPADWYGALVEAAAPCAQADGGISASDPWGDDGGRIYATAAVVLALAAPYAEGGSGAEAKEASEFLRTGSREVVVVAASSGTATGIYADPGMRLVLTARGTIQPWVGSPRVAADGTKDVPKSYKPLLKGAPFGCLLGRVGPEGKPFRIQSEKPLALTGHGQLFLLVNDDQPDDGSGAWTVRITPEK
jgi:hypothetical protein